MRTDYVGGYKLSTKDNKTCEIGSFHIDVHKNAIKLGHDV
jgi:hypothetical protein